MKKILTLLYCLIASYGFAQKNYLLVGTYTFAEDRKGIYVFNFDSINNTLAYVSNTTNLSNPSYLAISKNKQFIYAVNEDGGPDSQGAVSAFSFNADSGSLNLLNKVAVGGAHPCYVAVSNNNKKLYTANYGGGSVSELSINSNGTIGKLLSVRKFEGKSFNPKRQDAPHAHACIFSPDAKYLFITDLGTDKVYIHRFSEEKGLSKSPTTTIKSASGSGPRHLAFHPSKPWVYIIEEITGTVTGYLYKDGITRAFQTIASSNETSEDKGSADIHISPDGNFLYTTNRGKTHNIVTYSINQQKGQLTKIDETPTGEAPRNFLITASGSHVFVANQKSNSIIIFTRNSLTGKLTQVNTVQDVPSPVCLKMLD